MLLLNPGPVMLSERVRRSLLQPDLCHRESGFFGRQVDLQRQLELQKQRNAPFTPALHDAPQREGFVIYSDQSARAKTLLRLGTMGRVTPPDIERLCRCIAASL